MALAVILSACAPRGPNTELGAAEFRQDFEALADRFPQRARSLTVSTRKEFDRRVAELLDRSNDMTCEEFVMGAQWAVAAADNAHTEALVHQHQQLRLPVDVHWFADGLFVIAVLPGFEDLLGARVIEIEGQAPEVLLERLAPYVGGTWPHLVVISNLWLERPELLRGMGAAPRADVTRMAFQLPDGRILTRLLPGREGEDTSRAANSLRLIERLDDKPLYLRDPNKAALLSWLPAIDAAYVRLNTNRGDTLREDLADILEQIERKRPSHIVVDLRLNGGGNMLLSAEFAHELPELVPAAGRMVIITGRDTFSAGIVTAAILKAGAGGQALVVGELIGDRLQWWSEDKALRLSNSGLKVLVTDGFHDWENGYRPDDPRYQFNQRQSAHNKRYSAAAGSLEPDVPVDLEFTDYVQGRDPVLERIEGLLRP